MNTQKEVKLKRVMKLPHATAMVVGTIIGASIFVQPSEITGQVPSVTGVFLVWLISGILAFFGALVCAELASIYTKSGGVYIYLKEAFSPAIGFLWGWGMFWSIHSGIIAAISVIFARYVCFFFPSNMTTIKIIAIAGILLLSWINYLGVKHGSTLQTIFTFGKIIAIVFIIVIGFILGSKVPEHFVASSEHYGDISFNSFTLALIAGIFAFGGWHMVTYNSEETVNPRKTIPRALMLGIVIVTVSYIALNTLYMYILPLDVVASSKRIAADAANVLIGYGGGAFMSILVIFSTFGALSGIILCGPRVYYSMAQDGLLFKWASEVHPKYRTPHKAIVLQAIWSAVLVASGTYKALFTRVIYTEWIFFALMAFGLFLLRFRSGIVRDYKIWGYPVVPAIFIVSAVVIVINQIVSEPWESVFGLSIVLVGLPVYYIFKKNLKRS